MTVQQPGGAVRPDAGEVSGPPVTPTPSDSAFILTGVAQVAIGLAIAALAGVALSGTFLWITSAANLPSAALSALICTFLALAGWELAAIVGKWLLVGRRKPGRIALWGFGYLRFWTASLLVRTAPAARLIGSEWQRWHLNACGARVGRGTLLLCPTPDVPDLIRIGRDCLIGERTLLAGYRPDLGALELDRITIGDGCVIGDDCVLEPGSGLDEQSRLAPSSSLQPGQQVPADASWHGSPARPVEVELPALPRVISPSRLSRTTRRALYAVIQFLAWLIGLTVGITAVTLLSQYLFTELVPAKADGFAVAGALAGAAGLALALVVLGLLGALIGASLPRLLRTLLSDSRTFPLPSWRWSATRVAAACAGQSWLAGLFGGSALARGHLVRLGWQVRRRPGRIESFGRRPGQANPVAVSVGGGTIVGDHFWVANVEYSCEAFRFRPATIGANCSIGEQVTWPGAARVGEDCLLAARTAVPLIGPIRSGIGLQGSPAVETPRRSSEQPALFDPLADPGPALAERLNYDRASLGLRLLVSVIWLTLVFVEIEALRLAPWPGWLIAATILLTAVLIRWACRLGAEGLARLATQSRPVAFSILDPRFGRHQRVHSLGVEPPAILNGTPLRPLWWRLRGAEIGHCVFDDGAQLSEPGLVTIGDQVSLGRGCALQSHQTQDALYSMAQIFVADRSVVGTRAMLLGGTQLGVDTRVAADSVLFAVTGEADSNWVGNPAVAVQPETVPSSPLPQPTAAPAIRPRKPRSTARPATKPVRPAKAAPTPERTRPETRPAPSPEPAPVVETRPTEPPQEFALLGTDFRAQQFRLPELDASVAVLDLTDTPLRDLNLPQALSGFGIPEECLEDDLSLRDTPISASEEIRSLLARILLRQLLSSAHSLHQPHEWGFIRSSAGGLHTFWPTTDDSVSIGRSEAVVVAAIASGPLGVAVVPESSGPELETSAAQWLTPDEWAWLTRSSRGTAPTALARMAALKKAALKAASELTPATMLELDTLTDPRAVLCRPQGRTPLRLAATAWPVPTGGGQYWIAVVRRSDEPLDDEARG